MAQATITVSSEYGYVLLTAASSFVISMWHGLRIGSFRKAAKVPYPNAYASPEQIAAATTPEHKRALYLFNCAQRAHGNFLENYPAFVPALLVAGLAYPKAAAGTGVAWLVFRLLYATGYTRADKENGKGRLVGSGFWLAQLGLYVMVGLQGWKLLTA